MKGPLLLIIADRLPRGGFLRKEHPDYINVPTLIVNCVSVAIAFIPEGLPIAITAGLTITANLMKKNKILCKSLKTVETLGSVSVICSDKTGTLTTVCLPVLPQSHARCLAKLTFYTKGKMTVSGCAIAGFNMPAEEAREKYNQIQGPTHPLAQLRAISALCNAGEFDSTTQDAPLSQRKIFGDATDQAILRFAEFLDDGSVAYLRACWRKTYELAFNSKNKFMIRCFSNTKPEAIPKALSKGSLFEPEDV